MEDGSGGDEADPMVRIDPIWTRRYVEHFAQRNPLHNVDNPHEYLSRWTPRILTDEDWMDKDDLARTEFFNDFLKPQDIHAALMIRLARRGVEIATLNIGRPQRRGQFARPDLEVAERFHPHLIRAFDLGNRLAATRGLGDALGRVLDASPHGLFVLADDGRVLHVNRAGEALAAEPGGLCVTAGRLGAANASDGRRLQGLIAVAGSPDSERRTGGSMALATPTRRLPLSLTIAPIRSERFAPFRSGHTILVCVTDLEAGVSLPEQRLRDLFSLTPAETRVAVALFEGSNPREAAAAFDISPNTVRVHLARIFDKTGTRRQSELVSLMTRTIGVGMP
jgi:DNA-binding CsgD family transcriptional regulator/PAS domain-containing protein